MREEDLLLQLQLAGEALRNESIAEVSRQAFDATLETVVGLIGRAQRTGDSRSAASTPMRLRGF